MICLWLMFEARVFNSANPEQPLKIPEQELEEWRKVINEMGEQIISKERRIKELERQRRQYLNDYKMGLRKAGEIVEYIREIDAELVELKEK